MALRDADGLSEVVERLLLLEENVRAVQVVDDKHDNEEIKLAKELEIIKLKANGWIFESTENEFIGKTVRRFTSPTIFSDVVVVCYLPVSKNTKNKNKKDVEQFRISYPNGDFDNISKESVTKALKLHDDNILIDEDCLDNEPEDEEEFESDEDDVV